ncbi:MAG: hypothetical protein QNJ97_19475 [Myxococcota bacterium]|nr:hypothetical protein [Myxococcota bacterium]
MKTSFSKSASGPADLIGNLTGWRAHLALGLLVGILLSYSWMFSKITVPNERSRVYLSVALVDEGTLSIDGPVARFGKPIDIARINGRYYTDKAPGASLLGAGLYGAVRLFTEPADWSIVSLVNLMRTWLMIPLGLVGFFLLHQCIMRLGMRDATAKIVCLGWILGTSAFHYSTAFFGHQIVAVALLLALFLVESAREETGDRKWSGGVRLTGAGISAGMAGITEYQSAIPCIFFAAYTIVRHYRHPSRLIGFCSGASVFVGLLLAYNHRAFGGPFELSYHHLSEQWMQANHTAGIAGVAVPNAQAAIGGLFSLHRGLFSTSPMFLLVPWGLFFAWQRTSQRGLCLLLGSTCLYYCLFISSARMWHGGWGFGPRLLVPMMAWGAIAVAFAIDQAATNSIIKCLSLGLILCGVFYHQVVHLCFPELPERAQNPIMDVVLPAIGAGMLSPNLVSRLTEHTGLFTAMPAMILTFIAAGVVLSYGRRASQTKGRQKTDGIIWTFLPTIVLVLIIGLVGQTWPQSKALAFVKKMETYEKAEYKSRISP